jgi:hypothetical protein
VGLHERFDVKAEIRRRADGKQKCQSVNQGDSKASYQVTLLTGTAQPKAMFRAAMRERLRRIDRKMHDDVDLIFRVEFAQAA